MQDERLAQSLCYALVRLFRQVNRAHNRALAEHELSAEQAHVMVELWLDGPQKIGELQRALMLSSGTLTGTLDRMERIGLVRRNADPEDKRAFWVAPAKIKDERRERIVDTVDRTDRECFAGLTAAERRELHRLLEKASRHLLERAEAKKEKTGAVS